MKMLISKQRPSMAKMHLSGMILIKTKSMILERPIWSACKQVNPPLIKKVAPLNYTI